MSSHDKRSEAIGAAADPDVDLGPDETEADLAEAKRLRAAEQGSPQHHGGWDLRDDAVDEPRNAGPGCLRLIAPAAALAAVGAMARRRATVRRRAVGEG